MADSKFSDCGSVVGDDRSLSKSHHFLMKIIRGKTQKVESLEDKMLWNNMMKVAAIMEDLIDNPEKIQVLLNLNLEMALKRLGNESTITYGQFHTNSQLCFHTNN
jgi:hypothetical protein